MDVWIGNIDSENISILEMAAKNLNLAFKCGAKMEIGDGRKIISKFYPIFCDSEQVGKNIIKEYMKIVLSHEKSENLKSDCILLSYCIDNNEIILR